jgi:membrane-associated phospholipid phosphatase
MLFPTIISRLFDPLIVSTVLFLLAGQKNGVVGWDLGGFFAILLVTMILPPILALFWAIKTGRISNWDLSDRRQRIRAFSFFPLFLILDYLVLYILGIPLVLSVFLWFCVLFTGFFFITLFYKISGHLSYLTFIVCVVLYWYGWHVWPILFFIPLVAWSRLKLKRHTVFEVVVGVVYSICVFFLLKYVHIL